MLKLACSSKHQSSAYSLWIHPCYSLAALLAWMLTLSCCTWNRLSKLCCSSVQTCCLSECGWGLKLLADADPNTMELCVFSWWSLNAKKKQKKTISNLTPKILSHLVKKTFSGRNNSDWHDSVHITGKMRTYWTCWNLTTDKDTIQHFYVNHFLENYRSVMSNLTVIFRLRITH